MVDFAAIYDVLRNCELNERVGGGDPESVGTACANIIQRSIRVDSSARVLDFGCGIGRVLLALLRDSNPEALVGVDIIPDAIDLCQRHIANHFSNVTFSVVNDSNDHYKKCINDAAPRVDRNQLAERYSNYFTAAYSIGVLNHVAPENIFDIFAFIHNVLASEAEFLFTSFLLTPYSRSMISQRRTLFQFANPSWVSDGAAFVGNIDDPLAFVAVDSSFLEHLLMKAGFNVSHVEYGAWRGSNHDASLHDVITCRRRAA